MTPFGSITAPAVLNLDTGLGWEYIRIINSSPYQLKVEMGGMGGFTQPEMFTEDIAIDRRYNGKLVITPVQVMSSVSQALTNNIAINAYAPGEIRAPVAQPITTYANVGNITVAQILNTIGEAVPTYTMYDLPAGYLNPTLIFRNDGEFVVSPLSNGSQIGTFSILPGGGAGNFATVNMDGGLIRTNGQGQITATAPINLNSGSQETGQTGLIASNASAGGLVALVQNFKTVMTNTPTSITLNVANQTNNSVPSGSEITKYGFTLAWTATIAGATSWRGQYVTAGN